MIDMNVCTKELASDVIASCQCALAILNRPEIIYFVNKISERIYHAFCYFN